MEFVSHAARISDQCGCAAPQCAARAWRCWALLGAVAVLHSYTHIHLLQGQQIQYVTIGWLLPECQSGLWSVLSNATVYYSWALPVPQSNLAHSARAGRCHSITIYSYLHNKITYLFRHLFPLPIQQVAIQVQNIHYDILQSNKSKANKELKMWKKNIKKCEKKNVKKC